MSTLCHLFTSCAVWSQLNTTLSLWVCHRITFSRVFISERKFEPDVAQLVFTITTHWLPAIHDAVCSAAHCSISVHLPLGVALSCTCIAGDWRRRLRRRRAVGGRRQWRSSWQFSGREALRNNGLALREHDVFAIHEVFSRMLEFICGLTMCTPRSKCFMAGVLTFFRSRHTKSFVFYTAFNVHSWHVLFC